MASADGGTNVLFVVLDTVRKDRLSVYGHDAPTTPTLEALAEEWRVYEEAVAPAPWTLPVHASMFTGLYPSEHGANQEAPYLEGASTLAESVSAAGYTSACYSSNAWITPYTKLTAGFDDQDNFFQIMPGDLLSGPLAHVWKALNDSTHLRSVADRLVQVGNRFHERFAAGDGGDTKTPAVVDRTIEFVDDADGDFFVFLNLMDAHLPYHPPEESAAEFAPGVDSTDVCQNAKEFNCGGRDVDEEEWAAIRGLYDAEIRHMDDQLDRLFTHLRETGRWEDTAVVICADHGELHGEHDLYGHEFAIYDPLVNVPLLVKHPALEPGRDEETTVELLDLYHTILDATGVEGKGVPFDQTRSLLDSDYRDFEEPMGGLDREDLAFVEYHQPVVELQQLERKATAAGITLEEESRFYSRMGAARRPDAKFVHHTQIPDEGYRLDGDPGETENLAGTGEPAVDALAGALEDFLEDVGATWPDEADGDASEVLAGMDSMAKDRLRDLGYID